MKILIFSAHKMTYYLVSSKKNYIFFLFYTYKKSSRLRLINYNHASSQITIVKEDKGVCVTEYLDQSIVIGAYR